MENHNNPLENRTAAITVDRKNCGKYFNNMEVRRLPPCTVMCSKQLRKFGETLYANNRYKQIVYTGYLLIYKYISIKSKQYREKGLNAMLKFFVYFSFSKSSKGASSETKVS